jgi:4-hydroxyphenylpyruvate dioxygenase
MRRAIATVCISGTLEEKLESIARARFDAVEIFENDLIYSRLSPREIRQRSADLGLGIDLYQPFRDMDGVDDARFKRNLDRAQRKFDLMVELGAPMLLVCSNVQPNTICDDELMASQLHAMAEKAAERGLRIAYEALAWGHHVNRYGHSWEIVKKADHPHLGICLDSFHILSRGDDPAGIEQIPADKLFFLQLADAPRMVMDVLQWSRHYRCFPGQGTFDLVGFMEHVLKAGYPGPLSLEIFNDVFRAAPNRRTTLDAFSSLLYLEEQIRSRLQAQAVSDPATRALTERIELFNPPAPPKLRGLSFIEFAVDDASGKALGKALQGLGFDHSGTHRTKNVELYQQGDVRLVLNNEPGSFASDYFQRRGPSICALGLATDDGQRAVNRGVAFHVPSHAGRVGPNEALIPALRAVDDSIIYFVSQALEDKGFLETDFAIDPAKQGRSKAGIYKVDHLAEGFPFEQFDTGVLFNRVVLGLHPQESMELADPNGLVRSCAMVDADQSLRIALNVSHSRATVTGRSMEALQGGGVHHIALASDDIFTTAEYLKKHGIALLDVPDNYYEDLPARFELDDAQLERMRRLGVLYDRNEEGEFFHFYTQMFVDRFFFEIVQRRDGYAGFGASNAPVRMSAQARRS